MMVIRSVTNCFLHVVWLCLMPVLWSACEGRSNRGQKEPVEEGVVSPIRSPAGKLTGGKAIAGSRDRVGLEEARELIEKAIRERGGALDTKGVIRVFERTTKEGMLWTKEGAQLFMVVGGSGRGGTYLIQGKHARQVGRSDGVGVLSWCLSDLDNNGKRELIVTSNVGSGIPRSVISAIELPLGTGDEKWADTSFVRADDSLFVQRGEDSRVVVGIGVVVSFRNEWESQLEVGQLGCRRGSGNADWIPSVVLFDSLSEKVRRRFSR